MAKIAYVNGSYVHQCDAYVHMEDRGYQFADGVYEVIAFYHRRLLDEMLHLRRFYRSMGELGITPPMGEAALRIVMRQLIARNGRTDGTIYMQVTRGVARRDHVFPAQARASLTMTVTGPKIPKASEVEKGVSVVTHPDQRWARRDIKSVGLLPNVLAKQKATLAGAREAWLVDGDGTISEGSVSNNAIVTAKGEIVTHPANERILGGITRHVVLEIARAAGYKVVERAFTVREIAKAREAFIMGTTANILPVTKVDGEKIGNGKPGEVTSDLLKRYYEHIHQQTGKRWN